MYSLFLVTVLYRVFLLLLCTVHSSHVFLCFYYESDLLSVNDKAYCYDSCCINMCLLGCIKGIEEWRVLIGVVWGTYPKSVYTVDGRTPEADRGTGTAAKQSTLLLWAGANSLILKWPTLKQYYYDLARRKTFFKLNGQKSLICLTVCCLPGVGLKLFWI